MPLKTPETIDRQLTRSFANKATDWLMAQAFGIKRAVLSSDEKSLSQSRQETSDAPESCRVEVSLGRLTQQEAAGNLIAVRKLCRDWVKLVQSRSGWVLESRSVRWSSLGLTIDIPVKLTVQDPESLCLALCPGGISKDRWLCAVTRLKSVANFFHLEPVESNAQTLLSLTRQLKNTKVLWSKDYSQEDFQRLLHLVDWLIEHPDSNAFVREIPVEGLDTKWLERHQKEVCALFNIVRRHRFGIEPCLTENFIETAGLRVKPLFIRVRHAQDWRPGDTEAAIQLTLDELKEKPPASKCIVIIENEQTGLSLTIKPDIPILIGMGFGVAVLSQVKWLADKQIFYFGDLDTYGLAILSELKSAYPQTQSVLMDVPTLQTYRKLAVVEPKQVGKCPANLSEKEQQLFDELLKSGLRLEQERIPIEVVNHAFTKAVDGA